MLVSLSLLYSKNIKGPRTVTWKTPDRICFASFNRNFSCSGDKLGKSIYECWIVYRSVQVYVAVYYVQLCRTLKKNLTTPSQLGNGNTLPLGSHQQEALAG